MVQRFRMPKYANIWHGDQKGNKGEFLMEAQIGGRRRVGGNLLVRTVEPAPRGLTLVSFRKPSMTTRRDMTSALSRDGSMSSIMKN